MPHTRGPWCVIDTWRHASERYKATHPREIFVMPEAIDEPTICFVASLDKSASEEIHQREIANAHVLAASVGLLDAAKGVMGIIDLPLGTVSDPRNLMEAYRRLRESIAKAVGA